VGLFRRRKEETLNEQLLREAGLDPAQMLGESTTPSEPRPDLAPPGPPPFPTGDISLGHSVSAGKYHGGTGDWDTVVTVRAAGLAGDQVEFTALPNGDVIVDREKGDGDLSPLADAIEQRIEPPYHAVASRQDGDLWGIGAYRIEVAQFALAEGDAVVLSVNDGTQEVRVDGEPSDAEVPELVRLGDLVGENFCVEAKRIDGDFWGVEVSAL
jgi:hypothetical protein